MPQIWSRKCFKIMRLTFLLIFAGFTQLFASSSILLPTAEIAISYNDAKADSSVCEKNNLQSFSNAVILAPSNMSSVEQKAVTVLQEEILKRTGIELKLARQWPEPNIPVIAVGTQARIKDFAGSFTSELLASKIPGPEGFTLILKHVPQPTVLICGKDERGLLYGIGRLLRNMELSPKSILIPSELQITTAPMYPVRGHQLGYRPKVNAYDAWSVAQFDQYIRELALFGANSIEIIPPGTDDEETNPLMKLPIIEMMESQSEIIDSYGLDVWIWYPTLNYSEANVNALLAERDAVFGRLKRIDHVLLNMGDGGHLPKEAVFPFAEKVAGVLHKHHPGADIWISSQRGPAG